MYKSVQGSGNLKTDFTHDWTDLITKNYEAKTEPQTSEGELTNEWVAITGVAPVYYDNVKYAAILITMCRNNHKVSFVIISSTTDYENEIDSFGSSLTLEKIAAGSDLFSQKINPVINPGLYNPVKTYNNCGILKSKTTFSDGWAAEATDDYVLLNRHNNKVYIHYGQPVST